MPVQHVVLSAATGAAIPVSGSGAATFMNSARIQVVVLSKDDIALHCTQLGKGGIIFVHVFAPSRISMPKGQKR